MLTDLRIKNLKPRAKPYKVAESAPLGPSKVAEYWLLAPTIVMDRRPMKPTPADVPRMQFPLYRSPSIVICISFDPSPLDTVPVPAGPPPRGINVALYAQPARSPRAVTMAYRIMAFPLPGAQPSTETP